MIIIDLMGDEETIDTSKEVPDEFSLKPLAPTLDEMIDREPMLQIIPIASR